MALRCLLGELFMAGPVRFGALALLTLSIVAGASVAWAQAYPSRPIRAIVPFAAGSATDQIARSFSARMTESLGQPLVVEHRPGAKGSTTCDSATRKCHAISPKGPELPSSAMAATG